MRNISTGGRNVQYGECSNFCGIFDIILRYWHSNTAVGLLTLDLLNYHFSLKFLHVKHMM